MICIKKLQEGQGATGATDEDLELLFRLLHTVGEKLDKVGDPAQLRQRYKRLERFVMDKTYANRTRMLIQNLLEAREKGWSQSRWEEKPQTLGEIRDRYQAPGNAKPADQETNEIMDE